MVATIRLATMVGIENALQHKARDAEPGVMVATGARVAARLYISCVAALALVC